jgi:hypothetical protein
MANCSSERLKRKDLPCDFLTRFVLGDCSGVKGALQKRHKMSDFRLRDGGSVVCHARLRPTIRESER